MPGENVKVAVRVRPFNDREKKLNAKLIISMSGNTTEIQDPDSGQKKPFTFDYSYWSHDGFAERPDGYFECSSPEYADQKKVFDDLGKGVLDNSWQGYNCSLFAYGQTGSGKSYSMVGYNANKGIVPIVCQELFNGIDSKRNDLKEGEEFQVIFSMLEIYNEKVRDLLCSKPPTGGLKVRQHPNKGFYVENLTTVPVNNYKNIEARMHEGNHNRTVAATNMNATSSRAHTIVAITFTQKTLDASGRNMTRSSIMNLVDLAGSERATSTGAVGDRLKEGSAINQSLSTLGNVIKALADQSSGGKNIKVPYRDSCLTKLLANALGGNSKTIMIAALSPADVNYDETLSTLRFADRAKAIKTTATINESPTDKLIRELKEENQKLMEQLKLAGGVKGGVDTSADLKEVMERNRREMEEMERTWEEKLKAAQEAADKTAAQESSNLERVKNEPHLWNLNEDPALTNMVQKFCPQGKTLVGNGRQKTEDEGAIVLKAGGINPEHALITNNKGKVMLKPCGNSSIKINGKSVKEETLMHHADRIMFGEGKHLYVFHHPADYAKNVKAGKKDVPMDFDKAMEEIAEKQGSLPLTNTGGKDLSQDEQILREELVKKLPMVNQANSMSDELGKGIHFELIPISPQARGLTSGPTEMRVGLKNKNNGLEFLWPWDKFDNRYFMMQSMYENFMEGDPDWDLPKEKDPFWDPPDSELDIGRARVFLQSLAFMMDSNDSVKILDYRGREVGELDVSVAPCDNQGKIMTDAFVDDPSELLNREYVIRVEVIRARKLSERFAKVSCSYKFKDDRNDTATDEIPTPCEPVFAHKRTIKIPKVTQALIDYLNDQYLDILVCGRQKDPGGSKKPVKPNAVEHDTAKQAYRMKFLQKQNAMIQDDVSSLKKELDTQKKKNDRTEKKMREIQMLVNNARKRNVNAIPVDELERILASNSERLNSAVSPNASTSKTQKAREDNVGTQTSKACTTM